MLFEEVCGVWTERRLTQEDSAELLGVCPRTFRRWIERCEEDGVDGLRDRRLSGASHPSRRAGAGAASGGSGRPGRGCCCIRTAAATSGWRAGVGT